MNAELGRSKRGGGSAPSHCRTTLRSCMINGAPSGLRKAAKSCMSAFNECRTGGKKRTKKRTAKKRGKAKAKRGRR